jgi:rhodanese-related sulfurtransferase
MNHLATVPRTKSLALDPQAAQRLLETEEAILIDVRGFDEFAAGRAEPAKCIPLADLERRLSEIPSGKTICVMCASGNRSAMATERLRALGIPNIVDVKGGFKAWEAAGLPVQKQKAVIPLERQVRGIAGAMVFAFTALALFLHPAFAYGALFVGFMLFLSGVTGLCPMLFLLKLLPWNRVASQN